MEQFEQFLNANLFHIDSFHPHYNNALNIMLQAKAKRFRPALLLGVVKAYNPLLLDGANHAALAIELLHTYSLIHDDLPAMDDAQLRRGELTLHARYDETTAILAGDALNTEAFRLLSRAPFSDRVRIKLIESLATNGGASGMVLGQAIDCYFENSALKLEDIEFLHINKTAKLIAASLQMGAIIVGKKSLADRAYEFGIDLGLLFQIQDDILDVTQTTQQALKNTNVDDNKNSFVTLLGLDGAHAQADSVAKRVEESLEGFDEDLKSELNPLLLRYINRHKES